MEQEIVSKNFIEQMGLPKNTMENSICVLTIPIPRKRRQSL